eukprot:scaffold28586_cov107-Skeletonema_dohrnii-CCMP3373.AAC.6
MPSRKKAKGKARKAAKEAAKEEDAAKPSTTAPAAAVNQQQESLNAQMQQLLINTLMDECRNIEEQCRHGFITDSHKDFEEITKFALAFNNKFWEEPDSTNLGDCFEIALRSTWDEFYDVWNSATKMDLAISCFTWAGTDDIVLEDRHIEEANANAAIASYLEECNAMHLRKTQASINSAKTAELFRGDEHTVVKYLRKKIPCSCLDKKYKEVKSMARMGSCYNPNCSLPDQKIERSRMLYCTRCSQVNYCSPECQKADWKIHKEDCLGYMKEKANFEKKQEAQN